MGSSNSKIKRNPLRALRLRSSKLRSYKRMRDVHWGKPKTEDATTNLLCSDMDHMQHSRLPFNVRNLRYSAALSSISELAHNEDGRSPAKGRRPLQKKKKRKIRQKRVNQKKRVEMTSIECPDYDDLSQARRTVSLKKLQSRYKARSRKDSEPKIGDEIYQSRRPVNVRKLRRQGSSTLYGLAWGAWFLVRDRSPYESLKRDEDYDSSDGELFHCEERKPLKDYLSTAEDSVFDSDKDTTNSMNDGHISETVEYGLVNQSFESDILTDIKQAIESDSEGDKSGEASERDNVSNGNNNAPTLKESEGIVDKITDSNEQIPTEELISLGKGDIDLLALNKGDARVTINRDDPASESPLWSDSLLDLAFSTDVPDLYHVEIPVVTVA